MNSPSKVTASSGDDGGNPRDASDPKPQTAAAIASPWGGFATQQLSSAQTLFCTAGSVGTFEPDAQTRARQAITQAEALMAQGKYDLALGRFHEAVWLCPDSVEFHYRLAGAAEKAGNEPLLLKHLQETVRLEPCFAPAHYSLGKLYRTMGKMDDALYHLTATVALAPREARFVAEYGVVLMLMGQTDVALEQVQDFIDAPGIPDLYITSMYTRLAPLLGHEEKALKLVERALQSPNLTNARDSRPFLLFSASTLLDRLGRHDEAFEYACKGNEVVSANSPPFDPAAHSHWISEKIRHFSAERFRSLPRATHGNRRPVFIVGMPRSGTTLVEQILGCHPEVFPAGELTTLSSLPQTIIDSEWSEGEGYPMGLNSLSTHRANRLAEQYLSVINALDGESRYVTDKMPANFLTLELAELLFPGCHVIHCVRAPLDACLSCYMTNFAIAHEFKLNLAHLGSYYRDWRRLMDHWKSVLSVNILEMRYEDLVLDTEGQVRRMLDFLDLPFDENCLRHEKNARAVKTASEDQVRQPIYTSSIGRWKHYESHLGPLFAALGRSTTPRPQESDKVKTPASAELASRQ